MAKPWDDIMKRLFFANPQHFISWLMPGAILLGERNVVLKSRTLEADTRIAPTVAVNQRWDAP